MADVIEEEVISKPEDVVEEAPTLGVEVEEKPLETETEVTETDKGEDELEKEKPKSSFSKEDFKGFEDVLDMEKVEGIFGELDEDGAVPSEVLKKYISEVAKESKQEAEKIKSVSSSITKNPPKGVDIKELNGWISKQSDDIAKLARQLTMPSNGEESVRAGIEIINMLRMKSGGVGDPQIDISNNKFDKQQFLDEYRNVNMNKRGKALIEGLQKLKEKVKKTGDKELMEMANVFIKK